MPMCIKCYDNKNLSTLTQRHINFESFGFECKIFPALSSSKILDSHLSVWITISKAQSIKIKKNNINIWKSMKPLDMPTCTIKGLTEGIYIYIYIIYIYANSIKHNRHFMSTYFLLDPFEFPYYFYRIRG